ncbi:MAG TPA: hypothetical protein VGI67_16360 [Thermoleophilaceae bacterium]
MPRSCAALLLAIGLLLAFAASSASAEDAGGGGGGGSVAPPPTPKLPANLPGEKRERFRVILEGSSRAQRVYDIAGPAGGCSATLHADISEDARFGGGKGVTMDFIRFKKHGHTRYVAQRAGRSGGSWVKTRAKIRRAASGTGQLVQSDPQTPCTTETDDLSRWPGCGRELTAAAFWLLKLEDGRIAPRPDSISGTTSPDHCGAPPSGSAFSSEIGNLSYAWPAPARLPFRRLPLRKLFGTTHTFELGFRSHVLERGGSTGAAPLTGAFDDHGSAALTLRFVRQ